MWSFEMNVILLPMFLFSSLMTGVQVSPHQVIDSTVLIAGSTVDKDLLAFTPDQFILLKTLVESKSNDCKEAIKESISVCQYQLDTCYSSCDSTPKYYKDLINTLKLDVTDKHSEIKRVTKHNTFLKYLAISMGSLAVGMTTYTIIK